jgi:ATP-dependent DNA helicase DinG
LPVPDAAPRKNLMEDLLAPGGPVAEALGSLYEHRPQQSRMCLAVAKAMNQRSHLLAEAGTGVGKSFAYLLPAALRCVLHGDVAVVSTHTISLQEQIIRNDLPVIEQVLALLRERGQLPQAATEDGEARELRPVLVKGRGNYLSLRRLMLASQRQDKLLGDAASRRSLHVIEDWAYETRDGTLSSLPPLERTGVWDKVQSDSANCMGKRCTNFEKCFYQQARREMERGNLLICNHALFFSDLALRTQEAGFLPRYQHVVLDEAHNVEDVAGEHFGISLSQGRVTHLLSTLSNPRTGKGYLPQLSQQSKDAAGVDRAIMLVDRAADASAAFFGSLLDLGRAGDETGKPWTQRGGASRDDEPAVVRVRKAGAVENTLSPAMNDLALRLRSLRESVNLEADRYELNAYALRAEMIAQDAAALVEQAMPAAAYWVQISGGDDEGGGRYFGKRITLACAPIEVSPLLKEHLFAKETSVVLASATLATSARDAALHDADAPDPAFAHARKTLGCEGAQTLRLGSPFNYAQQARVYVERIGGGTRPSRGKPHADFAAMARVILKHIERTDGGAFVLFTSFSALNAVARELDTPLSILGFPLLAQGRDGSRADILERFRADSRSVLLGAASFWQGVDVRGHGLRNVIITKLPFDPPDRPIVQARGELIEARGGSPFMEDALPRAVIRFKQGFGRLIRSATDEGRVVILDDRVVTTRYGRAFLRALPEGVRIEVDGDEA